MDLVRGLHNLATAVRPAESRRDDRGCVLTVGNYDGVHLGHQHLISVLVRRADELKCAATVLVFEPSPKEFMDPAGAPSRLMRWREKCSALAAQGVDRLVTLRFDDEMRETSPQRFVDELLVESLGVRHIVVGDDFCYGAEAQGTIHSLRAAGESRGFVVEQVPPLLVEGVRVSSSFVRERLESGDCAGAAQLLGRRYRIMGRVGYGAALGRTLGFPTANLRLMRRKSPLGGILAVRVHGIESEALDGVAGLGTRLTGNGSQSLLEVHVFDFDGDLYGRAIEVEFIAKLRDEAKFSSLDSMKTQMKLDAAQARDLLSTSAAIAPHGF
jgi:riboflavin kinase/FMN adenylyltransferase